MNMPNCKRGTAAQLRCVTGQPIRRKALLAMIAAVVLTACASPKIADGYQPCKQLWRTKECVIVPLATPDEDREAKRFAAVPNSKARIYLVRPYSQEPKQTSHVLLDGKPVAELAPLTFAVLDVMPGLHRLSVQTGDGQEVILDLRAYDVTYVQYQLDVLFNTTTGKLTILPADEAQARIRQARRIAPLVGT